MSVAAIRDDVARRCRDFAWEQWSQLGVSGAGPGLADRRATDPEALLLFTLEAGRHDPRLFDEVLDWLVVSEQLVSVQRLRNLCVDAEDRALVDGALAAVARSRPRARLAGRPAASDDNGAGQPLFYALSVPDGGLDPAFEMQGLIRAAFTPSEKSARPDLAAPINLAFRLRRLLGVSARAEVVRALLTVDAPRIFVAVVQASAGFARPNVKEALNQLQDAGVARSSGPAGDLYSLDRGHWAQLLGMRADELPAHVDWIQLLGALRLVLRWLHREGLDELSEYMRASEARVLITELDADLRFAGVHTPAAGAVGDAYWPEFERTVRDALQLL